MKDNYELVENAALMGLNIEHLSFIRIFEDHIEKKQQMLGVEESLGSNEEKYKNVCDDEKYPRTESAFDHFIKEDQTVCEDVKSIESEPIEDTSNENVIPNHFTRPSLNSEHSKTVFVNEDKLEQKVTIQKEFENSDVENREGPKNEQTHTQYKKLKIEANRQNSELQ